MSPQGRARSGRWTWFRRLPALPALAALAVVLPAAACGSGTGTATPPSSTLVTVDGGTLTVGIDRPPTGCNPNTPAGDSAATRMVLSPVLPSAFTVGVDGQSQGDANIVEQAELVSTNPQTVVYTLNPQAKWSDGVPVGAADFVEAWKEQRGAAVPAAATGSAGSAGTAGTAGAGTAGAGTRSAASSSTSSSVTATTSGSAPAGGISASTLGYRDIMSVVGSNHGETVTVVFKDLFADWQELFHDLLPARVLARTGWAPRCNTVDPAVDLSAGPYELARSSTSRRIVLQQNPTWWGTPPSLDRIVIRVASGPAQLARWVTHGVVDVAQPVSVTDGFLATVASDPTTDSAMQFSSTFLQLEFSQVAPLTRTASVRQALAHALDRQALVNTVVGSVDANEVVGQSHLWAQGQGNYPPLPPTPGEPNNVTGDNVSTTTTTSPTFNPSVPFPTTADPAATSRLLTPAGFSLGPRLQWLGPDGSPVVLHLAVDGGDAWAASAGTVVAAQLRQAGFTVDVDVLPTLADTGAQLASGRAELGILPFESTPYPTEAIAWYTTSLGKPGRNGSLDWADINSTALNSLLRHAAEELNPVTAEPIYAQADELLWNEMDALPLFTEPTVIAWSIDTIGVGPSVEYQSLLARVGSWQRRVLLSPAEAATSTSTTH